MLMLWPKNELINSFPFHYYKYLSWNLSLNLIIKTIIFFLRNKSFICKPTFYKSHTNRSKAGQAMFCLELVFQVVSFSRTKRYAIFHFNFNQYLSKRIESWQGFGVLEKFFTKSKFLELNICAFPLHSVLFTTGYILDTVIFEHNLFQSH